MMTKLTLVAAFLFLITLEPSVGRAVTYDTIALGRVGSFTLIVEAIDANSQTCGIQKSAIYRAIEYPLVGTGLVTKLKDKSDAAFDVSMASIIIYQTICITNYDLEMTVSLSVLFGGQWSVEKVLLWSASGVFSSPLSEHSSRFDEVLRKAARDLVVSWNGARQGRTFLDRQ
jgi:hypothetical protein